MHPNKGIANLRRLVALNEELTDISALVEKERLVTEFWASMGNNMRLLVLSKIRNDMLRSCAVSNGFN